MHARREKARSTRLRILHFSAPPIRHFEGSVVSNSQIRSESIRIPFYLVAGCCEPYIFHRAWDMPRDTPPRYAPVIRPCGTPPRYVAAVRPRGTPRLTYQEVHFARNDLQEKSEEPKGHRRRDPQKGGNPKQGLRAYRGYVSRLCLGPTPRGCEELVRKSSTYGWYAFRVIPLMGRTQCVYKNLSPIRAPVPYSRCVGR